MLVPITISVAWFARLITEPDTVIAVPGRSVWDATTYSEAEFGVMTAEPIVNAGGCVDPAKAVCFSSVDVDVPTTKYVCESLVRRATTALEVPETRVISDPAAKVWPETTYFNEASGVIVLLPSTIGIALLVAVGFGVIPVTISDEATSG